MATFEQVRKTIQRIRALDTSYPDMLNFLAGARHTGINSTSVYYQDGYHMKENCTQIFRTGNFPLDITDNEMLAQHFADIQRTMLASQRSYVGSRAGLVFRQMSSYCESSLRPTVHWLRAPLIQIHREAKLKHIISECTVTPCL